MTCVIALYYDDGEGGIIISDSRELLGADYGQKQKVVHFADRLIFSSAGLSGMVDKLLPSVKTTRARSRLFLPSEIVNVFEDEMAALHERYKDTRPYRFGPNTVLLTGMIGFMDSGKPSLYILHENGYAEKVKNYRVTGHGEKHASNILKSLYDSRLSKERAIELGVHAINEVSKIDASVDSFPQIAILEEGISDSGVKLVNENKDGEFEIDCKEITTIKKRLDGIEEIRTSVFHVFLDGTKKQKDDIKAAIKEHADAAKDSKPEE